MDCSSSSSEEEEFPSIESVTPQSKIDTIYQSKTEKVGLSLFYSSIIIVLFNYQTNLSTSFCSHCVYAQLYFFFFSFLISKCRFCLKDWLIVVSPFRKYILFYWLTSNFWNPAVIRIHNQATLLLLNVDCL